MDAFQNGISKSSFALNIPKDNPPLLPAHAYFWEVWTEHQPFLLDLCLKWAKGEEEEAREMLHGSMLRAFERTNGNLEGIGNPRAWLAKVLQSYVIDTFRIEKHNPLSLADPDSFSEALLLQRPGSESFPLGEESYAKLKGFVENLPPRLRSAMILRAYQDMPYRDIANHLGITPETARKRVQEARDILRARMAHGEAIPYRSPDPQVHSPRTERKAAEEVLREDFMADSEVKAYAQPVEVSISAEQSIEWPVFHPKRPARIQQRIQSLLKYIEKHPSGWTKRLELSKLLEAQGKWREAIREGSLALSQRPQLLQLHVDLSKWLSILGEPEDALKVLEEGIASTPHRQARRLLGDHKALIQGLFFPHPDGSAGKYPPNALPEALFHQAIRGGNQPFRTNRMDREVRFWLHEMKALPPNGRNDIHLQEKAAGGEDAYGLHFKFRSSVASGEEEEAQMALRELKRLDSQSVLYYHARLSLLAHQGKKDRIHPVCMEMLDLHPGNLMALHAASQALQIAGKGQSALQNHHPIPTRLPGQPRWQALLALYDILPS